MSATDPFVLVIEWDRPSSDSPALPGLIGPFGSREVAEEWAALNVPNGTWEVQPLAYPFYRSNR